MSQPSIDFDLPIEIWYSYVFCFLEPSDLPNVRCCCKYFGNLTNHDQQYAIKFWTKKIIPIMNEEKITSLRMPTNYIPTSWFRLYTEWKRRENYRKNIKLMIAGYCGNDKNINCNFEDMERYSWLCQRCVTCDCPLICDLLIQLNNEFTIEDDKMGVNINSNVNNDKNSSINNINGNNNDDNKNKSSGGTSDSCKVLNLNTGQKSKKIDNFLRLGLTSNNTQCTRLIDLFLFLSIEFNTINLLKYLLSRDDAKINCIENVNGNNLLLFALDHGHYHDNTAGFLSNCKIIKILLTHPKMTKDIIVNHSNKKHQRAIYNAAKHPYRGKIIPLLIKKGIKNLAPILLYILSKGDTLINLSINDINVILNNDIHALYSKCKTNGVTTLMYAVQSQNIRIIDAISTRIQSMRQRAINKGDYDQLKRIDDFIYCTRKKDGYTAYLIACEMGFIQIVKLLIDKLELDVNKCYAKDFSCIGYKFTGSEVAKAKGTSYHKRLVAWLKPQEIQGWFYSSRAKQEQRYNNYHYHCQNNIQYNAPIW